MLNARGMKFIFADNLVAYPDALSFMEEHVEAIRNESASDLVWMLQHPALYTAGTSAKAEDLLDQRFPVYDAGRGGEYTYHGPGQLVAYVMMDLKKLFPTPDVKKFVWLLEEWIIQTLAQFDVKGERRTGRVGIWVAGSDGQEDKIAAIGIRIRRWVSFHGISINLEPDLSHFSGIVPCGIKSFGVTSLKALGKDISMHDLQAALEHSWDKVFKAQSAA